ncbi:MAG: GNAT family N-acetyltransferase [Bacillota bacterium]
MTLKMMIPGVWETKRLTIKDLTEEEIQTVQKLYNQGSFVHQWDGGSLDKEYVYRCFTVGDLPPNGIKDQFKIQVIRMKETGLIVGLFTTYHGYPMPETFYINYLYIDKKYHKQGLGQEVVIELLDILKRTKYNEVRANVAIKNWAALRFWSKLGLNTIQGIFGDKEHGVDNYADIELIKYL